MRSAIRRLASLLLPVASALPGVTQAQTLAAPAFSADYELTRPAFAASAPAPAFPSSFTSPSNSAAADSDLVPRGRALAFGTLRLATAYSKASGSGAGLSLEAGQQWFARLTVGRSLEADQIALGGGYRWREGETVSLQLSRERGQDRLGLAVRYDWPRYFVRFGYDPRQEGTSEKLRFSAGMRF